MPVVKTPVYNLNKPWVTKTFQHLVKKCQRAFLASDTSPQYRKLLNKVNRMASSLRKRYYAHKIEALHSADAHFWWKKRKQFLDSKQPNPFQNLQQHPNLSLADEINVILFRFSLRAFTTV